MSEFLDKLAKLEHEFDQAFLALMEHTGADGVRSNFEIGGEKYSLNIESFEIQKYSKVRSLIFSLKRMFRKN